MERSRGFIQLALIVGLAALALAGGLGVKVLQVAHQADQTAATLGSGGYQQAQPSGVDASAITGTTLASNVVSSSLTGVGTITSGTWNGSLILGQYGGTGVANTGKTITLGGNLTTSGAFASTFTMTNTTGVTFPTSGTLYGDASGGITSSSLLGALSDETGTGSAVFSASPTFTGKVTIANATTTNSDVTGIWQEGGTATTTITNGSQGFGTTSPMYNLTLAAGKSAGAVESTLTGTSTSYTINPSNGAAQLYRTGTAATTFTAAGFVPGVSIKFIVCNPGASAGALTWSGFHTFGTAPTQTTTANQCDAYSVGMTAATSTPTGIMYYAQAGAGLQ